MSCQASQHVHSAVTPSSRERHAVCAEERGQGPCGRGLWIQGQMDFIACVPSCPELLKSPSRDGSEEMLVGDDENKGHLPDSEA